MKLKGLVVVIIMIITTTVLAIIPVESVTKDEEVSITYEVHELKSETQDICDLTEPTDEKIEDSSSELAMESLKNEEKQYYDIPLSKELQDKVSYYLDYMEINLDESYVYALVYQESRFDPEATGRSGDSGYCQILQRYFAEIYGKLQSSHPDLVASESLEYDVYDEKTNLACGIFWLDYSARQVSGQPLSVDNITSALTAYNRGVNGAKNYYASHQTYVTEYSSSVLKVASFIQENNCVPK